MFASKLQCLRGFKIFTGHGPDIAHAANAGQDVRTTADDDDVFFSHSLVLRRFEAEESTKFWKIESPKQRKEPAKMQVEIPPALKV